MHVLSHLQRQQDFVRPGVARYQEDDHEDEEHPGRESINLDEKSAGVQRKFTISVLVFARIKMCGFFLDLRGVNLMAVYNLISKSYISEEPSNKT